MVSSNSAAAAAAAAVVSKCQARKKRKKKKRDPRKAEAQFSPSRLDWTTIVRTVALAVNSSSTVTEKLPSIIWRRGRQKNGERRANRRTNTDDKESAAANGKWKMGMQTDNGEGGQRRQVGRFNFPPALSFSLI